VIFKKEVLLFSERKVLISNKYKFDFAESKKMKLNKSELVFEERE
jgi:hypothetical protein